MPSDVVDVLLQVAHAQNSFQQHIIEVLTQYKQTGELSIGGLAGISGVASPRKRGKKPKLNKDGSAKQPRKPTAYNAWMQAKLKELKEAVGHDPEQKHVDTFKQAAHIWAELPKEEKDKINRDFKENQLREGAAVGGNAAEADAALDAAGEEDDDEEDEEGAPAGLPAVAAAPESSSEEDDSDEEEPPAPAPPKPKPAPAPVPVTPITEGKKKKKRKQAADLPPVKLESSAAAADGDKHKKKKKKKDGNA